MQLNILQSEAVLLANNQTALLAELHSIDTSIETSNNNISHLQQRNNLLSRAAQSLDELPDLPTLEDYRNDTKLAHQRETARLAARGARATAQLQQARLSLLAAQDKARMMEYRTKEITRQIAAASCEAGEQSVGSIDDWDSVSVASGSVVSSKYNFSEGVKGGFVASRAKFAIPSDKLSIHTLTDTRACTADDRDDGESVLSRELFQLALGEPKMLGKRTPLAPEQSFTQSFHAKPFVAVS